MIIKDYLYGEFEIDNVLNEIIETSEIQRLKGIYQGGASFLVNENWNVTRYDHSIGTMLLIKLLGGSTEEQIAGLIHDISHTAFSHVIDIVFDNAEEDFHETLFDKVVKNSDIPNILNKYNYDLNRILNCHNFGLLEKDAPKLCADRIDYTLRDLYHGKKITKSEIDLFINELRVVDDEIVLNSLESSVWFVNTYYKEVIGYLMNPLNIYACDKLSEILKVALSQNIITKDDLFKTDEEVINIINKSNNTILINALNNLNPSINVIENDEDYDIHRLTKPRVIDPTILLNSTTETSSNVSKTIAEINNKMISKLKKGVFVKVL